MSTVPDELVDILEKRGFAQIATIGPKGEPQVNPVWYLWDGEHLRFSQTTTKQKYRNLQRDPHIAVSILDPDDPYRYLELRGRVVEWEDDADRSFLNGVANAYTGADYQWDQPGDVRFTAVVEVDHTTTL